MLWCSDMCNFRRFWNIPNQTGKAALSVVFIQTSMFVSRWRWRGDGRGGSGACRAWYQRVVHWYVWKDGHLPARGTDRSYNPSHFLNFFPQLGSITIICLSTDVIFPPLFCSFCYEFPPPNLHVQAHAKITGCWRTWTNLPASSTWRWRTSASTSAETCRISTISVSKPKHAFCMIPERFSDCVFYLETIYTIYLISIWCIF